MGNIVSGVITGITVLILSIIMGNRAKFNKNKSKLVSTTVTKVKELFFMALILPFMLSLLLALIIRGFVLIFGVAISWFVLLIGLFGVIYIFYQYSLGLIALAREKTHLTVFGKISYIVTLSVLSVFSLIMVFALMSGAFLFSVGQTIDLNSFVEVIAYYTVFGFTASSIVYFIAPEKKINPDRLIIHFKERGHFLTLEADAQSVDINDSYIMVSLNKPDRAEIIPMSNIERIKAYYK